MRWNLRRLPEGIKLDVFLGHVNGTHLSYEDLKHGLRKDLRPRRPQRLRIRCHETRTKKEKIRAKLWIVSLRRSCTHHRTRCRRYLKKRNRSGPQGPVNYF